VVVDEGGFEGLVVDESLSTCAASDFHSLNTTFFVCGVWETCNFL